MIGKTPRVVAVKSARPKMPSTANTAKDTFSTVMPRVCRLSFGLMGCVFIFQSSNSTPVDAISRLYSMNFNSSSQTGENL
jgi:hypothetical protein